MIINFIDHQVNGLRRTPQHSCHFLVEIGNACSDITHENDGVSLINSDVYLLANLSFKNIIAVRHKPTGVDYIKSLPDPLCDAVLPVTGNPADVVDDRFALLKEPVKKSAL